MQPNNQSLINRVRARLTEKGIFKGNEIGTQGYLALYQNTNGTFTSLSFDVIANTGTVRSIERRLDNTDMFTITHWSMNILKATTTSAADMSKARRYTYPNQAAFTNYANWYAAYNGYLQVIVDRTTLIDSFDTQRFFRADFAEQGVNSYTNDTYSSQNYGYAELDPEVTLNGLGSNQITLNFPASTDLATGGAAGDGVLLVCRGIRWQNASKVNPS